MGALARPLAVAIAVAALALPEAAPAPAAGGRDDGRAFASSVRPILERRCRPCHFPDGKVYARLPFDRPETIRRLGSARLFTRLKDEKERAAIRAFLGEPPPPRGARTLWLSYPPRLGRGFAK